MRWFSGMSVKLISWAAGHSFQLASSAGIICTAAHRVAQSVARLLTTVSMACS
jgi:hypothetical protein